MQLRPTPTTNLPQDPVPSGDTPGLVGRICEREHSRQESRLEEAIAMATRAETVHRRDDEWPHGMADQLNELLDCIVTHQQREQAVVFPMLVGGVQTVPEQTIDDMVAAHEELLAMWRELDRLTGGFRAPAHACGTWRRLYALCDSLHADCRDQIDLENRMLLASRRPSGIRDHTEPLVAYAQRP